MEFERVSEREWEEIVLKSDDAYFFHSPSWAKILEKTYDYRTATRLYHINDSSVLIPMMVKNIHGFRSFSSMPYGYGGFFPESDVSSDELGRIVGNIVGGRNLSFNLTLPPHVNIASSNKFGKEIRDEWSYTHVLNLEGRDFEEIWKKYKRKTRQHTRKAVKSGVEVREGTSLDDYRTYYNLYETESSQKWGLETTPHPFDLYKNFYKYGSPNIKLHFAIKNDEIIAGMINFYYSKTVFIWGSAFRAEYGNYNPTSLLFNDSIENACQERYNHINFGGSGNLLGVVRAKEGFGAEKTELKKYRMLSSLGKLLTN